MMRLIGGDGAAHLRTLSLLSYMASCITAGWRRLLGRGRARLCVSIVRGASSQAWRRHAPRWSRVGWSCPCVSMWCEWAAPSMPLSRPSGRCLSLWYVGGHSDARGPPPPSCSAGNPPLLPTVHLSIEPPLSARTLLFTSSPMLSMCAACAKGWGARYFVIACDIPCGR